MGDTDGRNWHIKSPETVYDNQLIIFLYVYVKIYLILLYLKNIYLCILKCINKILILSSNRLISVGLEPVLSHTENSYIASLYISPLRSL